MRIRCQVDVLQRNRRRAKLRGLLDGPLVALGLLLLLVLLRARRSTRLVSFQLPTRLVSRRRFTCHPALAPTPCPRLDVT